MINRLMIAGFGGQGVMMIGKLIGQCAMEQDLNATFSRPTALNRGEALPTVRSSSLTG